MNRVRNNVLVAAAVFLMASACSDIPQPFRDGSDGELPLPTSPTTIGVGVIPVFGVTNAQSRELSLRIADALQEQEIPAVAVDGIGRMGFSLETTLTDIRLSRGMVELVYDWRVLGRNRNDVRHAGSDVFYIDETLWQNGSQDGFDQFAVAVGDRVAQTIAPPLSLPVTEESPWAGISVQILPPQNAPGDGEIALPQILAGRLARAGFEPPSGMPDFTVAGIVSVTRYDSVQDDIAIIWQVTDATGADMGEVRLDNRIPTGELDGAWGFVAEAIVDASFPGILEIIAASSSVSTP